MKWITTEVDFSVSTETDEILGTVTLETDSLIFNLDHLAYFHPDEEGIGSWLHFVDGGNYHCVRPFKELEKSLLST